MFCCNTHQFLCLCCIQGKCLFTQNRLSCFQTHLHVLIMFGMRGCHINKIHLFICHQISIGSISLLAAILSGKNIGMNLLSGCHRINPDILHLIYRPCHNTCNITTSHNSNIKISKHLCSSFVTGYPVYTIFIITVTSIVLIRFLLTTLKNRFVYILPDLLPKKQSLLISISKDCLFLLLFIPDHGCIHLIRFVSSMDYSRYSVLIKALLPLYLTLDQPSACSMTSSKVSPA